MLTSKQDKTISKTTMTSTENFNFEDVASVYEHLDKLLIDFNKKAGR